jgi:two-component system chemotaxis response regulator CheB
MASVARPTPASGARVVITDDSGLMRRILASALQQKGHEVVGEARDGDEALDLCARLRPDVLTLDLAMPGLDGIGVLRALRARGQSLPVIVVSAFSEAQGARAVDALAEGAFELAPKPAAGEPLSVFIDDLDAKVRLALRSRQRVGPAPWRGADAASPATGRATIPAPHPVRPAPAPSAARPAPTTRPAAASVGPKVVVIACSTGGPRALARLVPALPSPLGAGGIIVQHMPPGFTASLAGRLDRDARLRVVEAAGGERLSPDTLLMAPGGRHLRLDGEHARLSDEDPIGGLRPRADLAIADAAERFGPRVVLVVLTGMGRDGLEGARAVRRRGGRILCEAESTCTVFGMPRAVAEAGLADIVAPLDELPAAIAAEVAA